MAQNFIPPERRNTMTPLDIWHDDEGIWAQVGPQTFGPFETEDEAEAFVLARSA